MGDKEHLVCKKTSNVMDGKRGSWQLKKFVDNAKSTEEAALLSFV